MESVIVEKLVQIDIVGRDDVNFSFAHLVQEVNHKQTSIEFGHIQSVVLIEAIVHQMGITNVCIVSTPACSTLEIVTIDVVEFPHVILTHWVQVESIKEDTTISKSELWVFTHISNHDEIVNHLQICNFMSTCPVWPPSKTSMSSQGGDINVCSTTIDSAAR